ncbi:amino acid ABC transporter substrate-binding protein [Elizabethkingia meningoseptica]|uniref:LysM peptidoglycan-binding domain-containing protein n=1 Tax=Elizabethkingia meningoseptica TaxID=238 RepID=UPI00099A19D5|nr:LysM peptidoglycan-binding domain-containing protein [Elizabethkingia meningoseptica]MDE5491847.1 LysM peptidoglycan-binding domain-containing protein [Elizabethkingia meningoseptica]OPC19266.1 amino acid ABC transporter substrate-binding protein [Elizabethkingia meningoseptica]
MKKLFISALSVFWLSASAQKTHTVIAKDNPYSISKKYGLTLDQFYALNPGVKNKTLDIGDIVVISKTGKNTAETVTAKTTTGQISVKQGQSLYAIARDYHVSLADIKKLNPELGEGLQIGQKINLPIANIKKYGTEETVTEPVVQDKKTESKPEVGNAEAKSYVVQQKDTYYKITRMFNISQKDLFKMNPGLEEKGLKPGTSIVVGAHAADVVTETATKEEKQKVAKIDDTPIEQSKKETVTASADDVTYTVQQGDTIFGILNKFGISLDQLIELNPQLSGGLKAGMVLKIKKSADNSFIKSSGDALNVVLLLPFGFDTNDAKYRTAALDFLTGAKLAIQRNAAKGQKLNINVIDEGSEASFQKALTSINKDNTDLIVGPFFKSDVVELMSYVSSKKIPVISPFANSKDLYKYSNLIIIETDASIYAERIAKEVSDAYNGEKIYIVGDAYAEDIRTRLEKSLKKPNIAIVASPNDIQVEKNMMTGQSAPVIAVLASDSEATKTGFANRVIALGKEVTGVKAFSMFYSTDFDKKEADLGKVNMVYIMDRKVNTDGSFEKEVLAQYNAKFCKSPSKYAVVGFDVMNDALSRENSKGEIFRQMGKSQTHLATKFEYEKTKEGAYVNKGYRVIRLNP